MQDRVLDPERSTRIEGRLGPVSSTDHEATSTCEGTRPRWALQRDQNRTQRGRQ